MRSMLMIATMTSNRSQWISVQTCFPWPANCTASTPVLDVSNLPAVRLLCPLLYPVPDPDDDDDDDLGMCCAPSSPKRLLNIPICRHPISDSPIPSQTASAQLDDARKSQTPSYTRISNNYNLVLTSHHITPAHSPPSSSSSFAVHS